MPLDAPVMIKTSCSCQQNAIKSNEMAHFANLIWDILPGKNWSKRKEL